MSCMSCCGIRRPSRGKDDDSGQLTATLDSKTQCARPVANGARLPSTHSTNTSRPSTSLLPTGRGVGNANITAKGPGQNIGTRRPTSPPTDQSHIQPDLWAEAIATLSDDDRTWIQSITGDASVSVPDRVDEMIILATQQQLQCETANWKAIHIGDYEISLDDAASKIIVWLHKFKEIGDVVVQYDPVHAALPWAAARFILQAVIAAKDQMAASIVVVERVTRIVHRCQVFEVLYNRETVDYATVQNLESALIRLYATVLRGLAKTSKFLSKHTHARSLYAILHPNKGLGLLESLEHDEHQVDREIRACEGKYRANADATIQAQLRGLLEFKEPILRTDENTKQILQRLDREELAKIRLWISSIEYRKHHDTINELRTRDTCHWLLERSKFIQWRSAPSFITLWLQGFPGSGKTYLASKIIDAIETTLTGKENDEGFAFFYCNRNEENRRGALAILRSYVRQLSTTPRRPDSIYPQLREFYNKSQSDGSGWTLGLCREYLIKLLNLYPRTTLILDALDECKPEERTNLLDFFDSIPSTSSKPVRIFISSRPEGDIRQRLSHLPNIEIQATDNESDIAKFVTQSIEKNGRWRDTLQRNQPLKDEIVQTLLDQSRGMFQWAMLQIRQLLNLRTEREIRSRLGKLPKDLGTTYDEIYKSIEALDVHAKAASLSALRWIMCAYKPLTSMGLLAAIHVDPEEGIQDSHQITDDDLLDWCANLIRVDFQQDPPVWRVTHLSVVEYLESRWTLLEAHCFVAKANLVLLQETYGSNHELKSQPNGTLLVDIFHPLHELQVYVRHNWIRHVQTQEQDADPKLADLLKVFLGSLDISSLQYRRWHGRMLRDVSGTRTQHDSPFSFPTDISPSTSTAFLVCRFSLYNLLRDWWETPSLDLSQEVMGRDSLLDIATAAGCLPICERLCDIGLPRDKPLRIEFYSRALGVAIKHGYTEIAQLLLEKGADAAFPFDWRARGLPGMTPLEAAVALGRTDILQLLIEKGAHNMSIFSSPTGGDAFVMAALNGHTGVIRLLVENGADANMPVKGAVLGSPLAAAASSGSTNMVQLLIQNGADVNMPLQCGMFGSALAAAAFCGNTNIVQLLIEKGADINMTLKDGAFGNALGAAILSNNTPLVQLLIEKGAYVNLPLQIREFSLDTPAAADYSVYGTVIWSLMDKKADANMTLQIGEYGSALALAAYCGYVEIVQCLIANNADATVTLKHGPYRNALEAAQADAF
ncbi:hypothetical protein F4802DRAFT_577281 [Xylaria palmicola]|nr:hypothetical protein F4802DRAFT_577281 [Xylaria palmicola]